MARLALKSKPAGELFRFERGRAGEAGFANAIKLKEIAAASRHTRPSSFFLKLRNEILIALFESAATFAAWDAPAMRRICSAGTAQPWERRICTCLGCQLWG